MSLTIRATKGSSLTQTEMDNNMKEVGYLSGDIASASTTDLSTATGNQCNVTGTTTITSFGTSSPAGTIRYVRFTGALTVTYNASNLILLMGVNYTTRAGDILLFRKEGSAGSDGWRQLSISRGEGSILSPFISFPAIYDNGSTSSTAATINPTNGARQKITLAANQSVFTISAPAGSFPTSLQLDIYQDATGSRTWPAGGPASSKWPNGSDKVLSTATGARDRLVCDYDGSVWVCMLMKGLA